MKTIKTLLTTLLLFICTAAQAQVIVVEKTDGTKDEYQMSEVDSVAYLPAPKYYYYAGWECPSNEEELKSMINNEYPSSSDPTVKYKAGGEVDMTQSSGTVFRNYIEKPIQNTQIVRANYYVIIPTGVEIWDDISSCEESAFTVHTISISGHKVFISNTGSLNINAIKFVKQ